MTNHRQVKCIYISFLFWFSVGTTTVLSESKDNVLSSDETAAQLQQLQLYRNTQSTTVNKARHGAGKIQKQQQLDKRNNTDERVQELEKVFAELQSLKNQVSLTQQQLSDVQNNNTYLNDQLSLT